MTRAGPRTAFRWSLPARAPGWWAARRLFRVGAAEYTRWYHRLFKRGALESIDLDERVAQYGSPTRHVVGSCAALSNYWPDGYFDAVVCNGEYGRGLDREDDLTQTLRGIRRVLRPGGLLVFGFNDDAELDPLHLLANRERYFAGFEGASLAGLRILGFERYRRHTYMFFRTPGA